MCFPLLSKKFTTEINQIATLLTIKPGSTIAEIGAGNGKMTVAIARHVGPTGCIYCVEHNPKRVQKIQRIIHDKGLSNIVPVKGSQNGAALLSNSCDGIFMRGVYHHFTDPQAMNKSFFKTLKSGGLLLIIDFKPRLLLSLFLRPKGIPKDRKGHGIQPDIIIREVTEAGFELIKKIDCWPQRMYALVFKKP